MNGNPWARHYQAAWDNRASDPTFPLWFRMMALAYGRHEANGHANFKRGQLSWILGTPQVPGPGFHRVERSYLQRTLKVVIGNGLLAEGSCTECLIVPGHAVAGGLGDPDAPCPVHIRKRRKKTPPQLRIVVDE
ncbi:hypothetical protein [Mycobacterium sp. OTB74]|jgi:hypothetical protein|uniref:hypothetical protein n=1 Tax=Mycobacterium sp. OTB74 TaxID=1853452 RepID=UPI0024750B03|nr:hypothetical protein [Mycobacterium sp. OTB74]MDH6245169.1 hypothetical protein [Mycobacterium sp. OTB74]